MACVKSRERVFNFCLDIAVERNLSIPSTTYCCHFPLICARTILSLYLTCTSTRCTQVVLMQNALRYFVTPHSDFCVVNVYSRFSRWIKTNLKVRIPEGDQLFFEEEWSTEVVRAGCEGSIYYQRERHGIKGNRINVNI